MFGIVIAIAFQKYYFCLEMHQNEVFFYLLKFIFDTNTSKPGYQNDPKS